MTEPEITAETTNELLTETVGAVKELVGEMRIVRVGFERERGRRRWAVRILGVAVVLLLGAVGLLARDNAGYRQHRCESANDSRAGIKTAVERVLIVAVPVPSPAQRDRIDAVNADLAKHLPQQTC